MAKSKKKKQRNDDAQSTDRSIVTGDFTRQFIRRHIAPEQRQQADVGFQSTSSGASSNINLLPQSTKRPKTKIVRGSSQSSSKRLGLIPLCRQYSVPLGLPEKLHKLWLSHTKSILAGRRIDGKQPCSTNSNTSNLETLLRLNFVGARLSVLRSSSVSYAGRSGIVLVETKLTFAIVVEVHPGAYSNSMSIVPKVGSVFRLFLPDHEGAEFIVLNGEQLAFRPLDRAIRRWRKPNFGISPTRGLPNSAEMYSDLCNIVYT